VWDVMMHFLRVIFLLLALVKRGLSASLATPFDGTVTYDGDKFTIITKSSAIVIERFDIHMKNVTATIRILTRTGCKNVTDGWSSANPQPVYFVCGYPQDEYTDSNDGIASDWTQRYSGTLTGLGQNVPTPMPAINLNVPANTTLGVYITSTTENGNHLYQTYRTSGPDRDITYGLPTPVFASDNYISIHEGFSEKFNSLGNELSPTRWNGKWIDGGQIFMTFDAINIVLHSLILLLR
jgi:hypothetical protein